MSTVDELLFAPIEQESDQPWRVECRRLVEHLKTLKLQRVRPIGALLLEDLMERFHLHKQTLFWSVDSMDGMMEFEFSGDVYLTDSGNVLLNDPDDGWGVIEFNLFPNEYNTDMFIFSDQERAKAYARSL